MIEELQLSAVGDDYALHCRALIEFENEGVAQNERFEFRTTVTYRGRAPEAPE